MKEERDGDGRTRTVIVPGAAARRAAEDACFLAPITQGGDSTAADERRQPEDKEVMRFRRKVAHWDADRKIEEFHNLAPLCADDPTQTWAFAGMREMGWEAQDTTGKDAGRLRAADAEVWPKVESNWAELQSLRAQYKAIDDGIDESRDRLESVRSGRESRRTSYFNWKRSHPTEAADATGEVPTAAV